MAEEELGALRQAYDASLRQLRTLLDAQARLRSIAEQTALGVRRQLERVAEALAPEVVDALCKQDPEGLGGATPQALADVVIRDVRKRMARLNAAEVAGYSVGELYDEAIAEVMRLRHENARLREESAGLRREKEQAELRAAVLQRSLEDLQRRPASAPDPALESPAEPAVEGAASASHVPEWMQEWQGHQSFERDLALLQVLAEMGLPRRTEVAGVLADRLGLDAASGSMGRLFQRCAGRLGLIELIEAETRTRGRATQLVYLTERGRDACRLLLDQEPVESHAVRLLARCGTPEQALLNLEAADLLQAAGYRVDLFPGQVALPDDQPFVSDLAISMNGRQLFVEVEGEACRDAAERDRRWGRYYDAGGGEFRIVAPDRSALDSIKSEIMFWTGGRPLALWMTSISDARGRQGDAVWLFRRSLPQAPRAEMG